MSGMVLHDVAMNSGLGYGESIGYKIQVVSLVVGQAGVPPIGTGQALSRIY
jgi:hypothetical protein